MLENNATVFISFAGVAKHRKKYSAKQSLTVIQIKRFQYPVFMAGKNGIIIMLLTLIIIQANINSLTKSWSHHHDKL